MNHLLYKLIASGALTLCVHPLSAQDIDHHIVHNFSGADDVRWSEVKHVLTLQESFYITGNVLTADSQRTVYVAVYNYEADQQWSQTLAVPDGVDWLELRTFENLKPFGEGHYAIGGNAYTVSGGDTVGQPFIYVFTSEGDSVYYYQHNNVINIELGAVNIGHRGELLLGGVQMKYGIGYQLGADDWTDDVSVHPNTWMGKLDTDYATDFILVNTPNAIKYCSVRNIFQLKDNPDDIFVAGYHYMNHTIPINIIKFSFSDADYYSSLGYLITESGYSYIPQMSVYPLYDYSAQPSRYNTQSYMWGRIIGSLRPPSIDVFHNKALDFAYSNNTTYTTHIGHYPVNPLMHDTVELIYNNMLKIRESWDTDILCVKGLGFEPYAIPMEDYVLDPIRGNSLYIRTDQTGVVKGARYIEYFPFAPVYRGAQMLLDIDQRPDGQKIVMVGYIHADSVITDMWEDVGRTSWIVIMNDTSEVIPPTPTSIEAEDVSFTFEVYPNPTTDEITIQMPQINPHTPYTYDVYNILGQHMDSGVITTSHTKIATTSLVSGQYIIVMSTEHGERMSKSFIKK